MSSDARITDAELMQWHEQMRALRRAADELSNLGIQVDALCERGEALLERIAGQREHEVEA